MGLKYIYIRPYRNYTKNNNIIFKTFKFVQKILPSSLPTKKRISTNKQKIVYNFFLPNISFLLFCCLIFFIQFYLLTNSGATPTQSFQNKPVAQAGGADPSRCNFTNRQNPPVQQKSCNFWTDRALLILFEILNLLNLCNIVYFWLEAPYLTLKAPRLRRVSWEKGWLGYLKGSFNCISNWGVWKTMI